MTMSNIGNPNEQERDAPFSPRLIRAGFLNFAAFAALLGVWSLLVPIKSAVLAPGFVSVDTYRKKVQHLEGGIIDEIAVREGDRVKAGQLLLRMRDVAQSTNVTRLQSQFYEALAIAAQCVAERDGLDVIAFPAELTASDNPAVRSVVAAQTNVFDSQRQLFQQTLSVMQQKVVESQAELQGLKGQVAALEMQIVYANAEIEDAQNLYKKELMAKPRLLKLQRDQQDLRGRLSETQGRMAQIRQQMLEFELKITEAKSSRIAGAVDKLREQQAKAEEFRQQLIAARDVMHRTEIRSPIEGTVVDLQVHTREGVVAAGETLMEIVPTSDLLVVEGRLRPEDRDEVSVGLETYVQLTTATSRDPRPIKGKIESISADRLLDKGPDAPYYRVRVHLDPASIRQQNVQVLAGMGADIFIQTGERTPFQYLAAPITRAFDRGLRER
jgi:HlyD family type I secretion membrane fusion protein